MLTQKGLKKVLYYNSRTGVFIWLVKPAKNIFVGDVAGTITHHGYVRIKVGAAGYMAHRLAWLYVHGKWPDGEIDHRDHNRANNRIKNLRDVTISQNRQHQIKAHSNNKLGVLGVHYDKRTGKFVAMIKSGGKNFNLGYFNSIEAASTAYVNAKRDHHLLCAI